MDRQRFTLFSLAVDCPAGGYQAACPLRGWSGLAPTERYAKVMGSTDEEVAAVIAHHADCLSRRTAEKLEAFRR